MTHKFEIFNYPLIATFGMAVILAAPLHSQVNEQEKFAIRISEIKRTAHACTVIATSDKAKYGLIADVSAACAMLEAGKEYNAYRAISGGSSKEGKDDHPVLIVFNNKDNKRRPNAVFEIVSEKIISTKPCPSNDPVGLYTDEACQPLPPQKKN